MILPKLKIIWANSRSLEGKVQNSCAIFTLLMGKNWKYTYCKLRLLLTGGCIMIQTQGHFGKFNVIEKKVQNLCLLYTFVMESKLAVLTLQKTTSNLRICQELDPRSVVLFRSHF